METSVRPHHIEKRANIGSSFLGYSDIRSQAVFLLRAWRVSIQKKSSNASAKARAPWPIVVLRDLTSYLGQSLPNCEVRVTSVYPSISDMTSRRCERREGTDSDMHHRIGVKLRPRQVVSATCGQSFPR
jgi:hypothetical protein